MCAIYKTPPHKPKDLTFLSKSSVEYLIVSIFFRNNAFPTTKGKVQAKKISDIDFEKLTLDDQQFGKKPGPSESSTKMISNENTIKFESNDSAYKPSGYSSSKNNVEVNDKIEEMKKKNVSHISSDALFSKNETWALKQRFYFKLIIRNYDDKINYSKFSNSTTSISSNQFYGKEEEDNDSKAYDSK